MKMPVIFVQEAPAVVSRPRLSPAAMLAKRFQQNWLAKHPQDTHYSGACLDDSLTSLGWLQNLKVSEITQPRQSSASGLDNNRNIIKQEPPGSPSIISPHNYLHKMEPRLQVGDTAPSGVSPDGIDYKTNPYVKPPYSYASLICMAMKATRKNKITLSSIYNWITDNFMYYRLTDPSWQNSIRHNLSLNKCFEKVARRKDEPGKGGFWRINPQYGDLVENGVFKKRRGSRDNIPSPPMKRFKVDDDDFLCVAGMKSTTREDKLLSNGSSDFSVDDDDTENSLTLKGDFNWTTILSQDIDIGGRKIKTEEILDETDNSPFLTLSPPSSETNSDELGLDEFFSQTHSFPVEMPLDFQSNDPLDLTVQGTTIKPPDWWTMDNHDNHINNNGNCRGLNTPRAPSPDPEHVDAMWGDSLGLNSSGNQFDLDKLFEFKFDVPSP